MWIFKNDAFVSIVQDRDMPDQLWARARLRGDLEKFFGNPEGLEVIQTDDADYRFRCAIDRHTVKMALIMAVDQLDYENFKGSIPQTKAGNRRHDWYLRIWSASMTEQRYEVQDERREQVAATFSKKPAGRKRSKKKGAQ